jgi:RecA/RadA recombinase
MNEKIQQAKAALSPETEKKEPTFSESDCLSSGLTLLNLATYNRPDVGLVKGRVYRISGHSSSGKTFIGRTILAEATINQNFNGYELIYDDVEEGALMDTMKFFGKKLVDRLVPPGKSKGGTPIFSKSTLDFYKRVNARLDKGKKFIWICDSLDALRPDAESAMTDGKAKIHSQELRKLIDPIKATGSILILVSQVRVAMNSVFKEDITAGGLAPRFYSTWDVHLRKIKKVVKSYKDRKYPAGNIVLAKVNKTRLSGSDQQIQFRFDPQVGIDDVGSNIDFLLWSGHWTKEGGRIQAKEFNCEKDRDGLIEEVESTKLGRHQLRQVTAKMWKEIQDAISIPRRPKYE